MDGSSGAPTCRRFPACLVEGGFYVEKFPPQGSLKVSTFSGASVSQECFGRNCQVKFYLNQYGPGMPRAG